MRKYIRKYMLFTIICILVLMVPDIVRGASTDTHKVEQRIVFSGTLQNVDDQYIYSIETDEITISNLPLIMVYVKSPDEDRWVAINDFYFMEGVIRIYQDTAIYGYEFKVVIIK